jgi:hypothetical protein
MKKTAILIGSLLLTLGSFAQFAAADTIKVVQMNSDIKSPRKDHGYYFAMHASFLFGNTSETESYFPFRSVMRVTPSFTITNGYMFNKHWAAGAGVGYEIFTHNFFPLFAELRYTWWDNKISPFGVIKGGYSICSFRARHYDELYLSQNYSYINDADLRHYGGVMVHPEMGVKVALSENSDILFTVAYRYQKSKSVARVAYGSQFDEWELNEKYNRLSFGIAITFR